MRHIRWQKVGHAITGSGWSVGLMLLMVATHPTQAGDWPQWLGPERDAVWREKGILERFPTEGPTIRWRTPLGGGFSGPAVARGKLYITDRIGPKANATDAANDPAGRKRFSPEGQERVVCLEEKTGKVLWVHEYVCAYDVAYPEGPRTTPLVDGDKVFTLGTMGDLLCLDADTGKARWSKNFPKDYKINVPVWGFSAHPLVDGNKLICIVGGQGSAVVAFDKQSGKELWRALSAREPGYSSPMIYTIGGKRHLIVWHSEALNALDPETGQVFWSHPFQVRAGLSLATPRLAGDLLFVSSFYNGSLMLKVDAAQTTASVLWQGKKNSESPRLADGLHSIISTPFLKDGYIYGVCSYGQLRCLKAGTGERVWETLKATGKEDKPVERWANAFLVAQGDRFFLFNEKGDLIIARLTSSGYEEISRAHIIDPTNPQPGRLVVWSHPAFANQSVYARNDQEIVCVWLGARPWTK
jgi:outer membrane protein assembly factor BamB